MRTFQFLVLIFFLVFFLAAFFGAYFNLKKVAGKKKPVLITFCILNLLVFVGFVLLYIYPFQPRTASGFPVYFYFNTFLFATVLFNLPMAFAGALQFLFRKLSRQPVFSYVGLLLALPLSIAMIFGTFVGSRQIKTTEVELFFPDLPKNFEGYKIVQLSDFHLGGMLRPENILDRTAEKLEKLAPEIIVFTGDLVNNFGSEITGLEKSLGKIARVAPVYSILGNHDYGDYTEWESPQQKQENFESIVNAQVHAGFHMLNNDHVVLKNGSDSVFLAGVENWGLPPFPQYADLERAADNIPDQAFTILLSHDPAHWKSKVEGKESFELTLSGHTHGMQWGIKPAGITFSVAWLTRQNWGGVYRNENAVLYVNTGLGTVGMPWRLDMPGEITLLVLKRGKID